MAQNHLICYTPKQQTGKHTSTHQPQSTKNAIPYSQAARIRRICTDENDFDLMANKLKKDLLNRGYQEKNISDKINRAKNTDRTSLLTYKEKTACDRTPLIVTYNKALPDLRNILSNTWNTLQINPTEKKDLKTSHFLRETEISGIYWGKLPSVKTRL